MPHEWLPLKLTTEELDLAVPGTADGGTSPPAYTPSMRETAAASPVVGVDGESIDVGVATSVLATFLGSDPIAVGGTGGTP